MSTKAKSIDLLKNLPSDIPNWMIDLKPFEQGGLDSSCSVYAAINLMRLALAVAGNKEKLDYDELLDECVAALESNKLSARLITGPGLGTKHWRKIVEAAAEEVSDQLGVDVLPNWEKGKVSQADIESKIEAGIPVALLTKPRDLTHYTVIKGFTEKSFLLFDSTGRSMIPRLKKSGKDVFIKSKTVVTLSVG